MSSNFNLSLSGMRIRSLFVWEFMCSPFENVTKIPNYDDLATEMLLNRHTGKCPKCDIPWKETVLLRFSAFDCPKCGAKKEDYVNPSN